LGSFTKYQLISLIEIKQVTDDVTKETTETELSAIDEAGAEDPSPVPQSDDGTEETTERGLSACEEAGAEDPNPMPYAPIR
jgi:hypothetical protein